MKGKEYTMLINWLPISQPGIYEEKKKQHLIIIINARINKNNILKLFRTTNKDNSYIFFKKNKKKPSKLNIYGDYIIERDYICILNYVKNRKLYYIHKVFMLFKNHMIESQY